MQFQKNDWSDFDAVGIEEVYGLVYGGITDQNIRSVVDMLGPALSAAVTAGNPSLSEQDVRLVTPSLSNSKQVPCRHPCRGLLDGG